MIKNTLITLVTAFILSINAYGNCNNYTCNDNSCDPCKEFFCDPCGGWSLDGEWIYWRPRRCELDFAIPYDGTNAIGSVHHVEPCYDSGFRVALDKKCNGFALGASYTYFRTDKTKTVKDTTNGDLAGTRLIDNYGTVSQGTMELAKGEWELDYDVADIVAKYNIQLGKCLCGELFGGFKVAFIDQELDTLYATLEDASTTAIKIHQTLDLDAYGITLGVNTDYPFCNCYKLFGSFGYDLFLGEYDRNFQYKITSNGGTNWTSRADLDDSCWRMISVFNLSFGLEYELPCWCNMNSSLAIGYEFHNWLVHSDFLDHTNESGEITIDRHVDNLSFDGLFVRLSLDF